MEKQSKTLEFRWTVSRGRETYGYNICSLWVDGKKEHSCNGGGYDMQGTCLGDWLQENFQAELLKIGMQSHDKVVIENKEYKRFPAKETEPKLYGMRRTENLDKKTVIISCDGGCGWSSMIKIAIIIGISFKYVETKDKNSTIYIAEYEI